MYGIELLLCVLNTVCYHWIGLGMCGSHVVVAMIQAYDTELSLSCLSLFV